jgi:hypothetical protein
MAMGFKGSNFAKVRREAGDPVSAAVEHPRFEALPPFTANSLTLPLEAILPNASAEAKKARRIVFHALGDTGGVNGTETQIAVAEAMEAQITGTPDNEKPQFFYHLGDVVYFNGLSTHYIDQFYEPYQHYNAPIFAIPGNHDGDTETRRGDEADNETSLYGFMKNFCSPVPDRFFKYRSTMTQPFCYWTLLAPFVQIIGLYSNVDGLLDARGTTQQQTWLVDQLKNAPQDKWLIVAVHHPCFSLDAVHGGYEEILSAFDSAFDGAGRVPDAVLSGHVHNYQRFSRKINAVSVPYIINGNGGYANSQRALHKLQRGIGDIQLPYPTKRTDVTLQYYDTANSGFLRLTAAPEKLLIEYFSVSFDDPPVTSPAAADSVSVPAGRTHKSA